MDELIELPGANKSTIVLCSLEYHGIVSDLVVAPTVIAVEIHPGEETAPVTASLPEAIIVATPAAFKSSMMDLSTSSSQAEYYSPPPKLIFAAATLTP